MLTVKLIDHRGQQEIFECTNVALIDKEDGQTSDDKQLRIIHGDGITYVDSGQVYVMNSNGKTVADYLFSMPPQVAYGYKR